ncbi:MAG TPA: leucyl/phenylalanyl-tRNA--protein transferase [Flavisolibacter sp.]|nr:leucyl/phenylalanyl-tRNA--protein transferase [Flavisolibacter sp.]
MHIVGFEEEHFEFPPVDKADSEGLILIGGKLTPAKVLEAYKKGIFPWYNDDEPILWWSPDPRFVLCSQALHISRSMQKVLRQQTFTFKMNTAFEDVIHACKTINRDGQPGTWITNEMKKVYTDLFHQGYGFSAEAWKGDELVGGIYGVKIGNMYYGESMFSRQTNASKFAFISFIESQKKNGLAVLDCQLHTPHVESLGGQFISRKKFIQLVEQLTKDEYTTYS